MKYYGFVYHYNEFIEIHVQGFSYHKFIGYTERQAKNRYRTLYGLKHKKIEWI